MCGVLVVIDKSGKGPDLPACRRALSSMTWRGPDKFVSSVWEGRVFIGQTILSLTGDISSGDRDHLTSRTGRYTISFNGEVYNFRELASSRLPDMRELLSSEGTDSEVLANLHETLDPAEVPGLLDGMFAYCLLDRRYQTLTLSRDVQGEKSLYIFEDAGRIVISSEIRAILELCGGASLDAQALRDYFRTRHLMIFERTIFRGIRQLLPGAVERIDLGSLSWTTVRRRRLRDWIDPKKADEYARRSPDELADELDSLMARCTREMIPAGRPFAAVVSGGIDSSLIARYLVRDGSPTALVAVDHVGKDRISCDLSGFEKTLGRGISVLRVDHVPYAAEIVRCQKACGSPLLSHSFVPQALQSAHVRSAGARVLFGGDGGDEIFGGYSAYQRAHSPDVRFSPSPYTGHTEPELGFVSDDPSAIQAELADAWADSLDAYRHVADPGERTALAMMYCDAAYQLPSVGLRGSDLMSMMWSVEVRSVLIRRPLCEFALNLPLWAKVDPDPATPPLLRTKALLKRVFLRHYPPELVLEKQGFAGFPNESAAFLGDASDFLANEVLGIRPAAVPSAPVSKAAAWKLANIEYFLRGRAAP